jgi:hypothetical protein
MSIVPFWVILRWQRGGGRQQAIRAQRQAFRRIVAGDGGSRCCGFQNSSFPLSGEMLQGLTLAETLSGYDPIRPGYPG